MVNDDLPSVDAMRPLTFTLSPSQRLQSVTWFRAHNCGVRPDMTGAVLTYQFTPNGIGDGARVLCPCGAALDVTDVSEW